MRNINKLESIRASSQTFSARSTQKILIDLCTLERLQAFISNPLLMHLIFRPGRPSSPMRTGCSKCRQRRSKDFSKTTAFPTLRRGTRRFNIKSHEMSEGFGRSGPCPSIFGCEPCIPLRHAPECRGPRVVGDFRLSSHRNR